MKVISKRPDGSVRVVSKYSKPSRVQEQFKKATDVNEIMKKYKYRDLPNAPQSFADWSELPSYMDALKVVIAGERAFEALPSDLRLRFNNDPDRLQAFLKDESNRDEAIKLGLVNPPAPAPGPSDADRIVEAIKESGKSRSSKRDE